MTRKELGWALLFVSVACAAAVTLVVTVAGAHDTPSRICGDVDGDAQVTATDALRVLHRAVGLEPEMRCNNRRNY